MSVTNEEPSFNFSLNSKINQKSKQIIKNNSLKLQGGIKMQN